MEVDGKEREEQVHSCPPIHCTQGLYSTQLVRGKRLWSFLVRNGLDREEDTRKQSNTTLCPKRHFRRSFCAKNEIYFAQWAFRTLFAKKRDVCAPQKKCATKGPPVILRTPSGCASTRRNTRAVGVFARPLTCLFLTTLCILLMCRIQAPDIRTYSTPLVSLHSRQRTSR